MPPGKYVSFKIKARARDCVPEPTRIEFMATAFLFPPEAAPTCFLEANPSNVTIKAIKGAQQCPAGVVFGAPFGTASIAMAASTPTTFALAPNETFQATNNAAQDALRQQQREGRAAWRLENGAGESGDVHDPVLQPTDGAQAAAAISSIDYSVCINFSVGRRILRGGAGSVVKSSAD